MRKSLAVGVVIGALTWTQACATNPATGDRQLSLVSVDQEIAMGRQAAQQVQQTLSFVDSPALQQYVARVGGQIAAGSERPDLPWAFHVVDDPTPNAFALPGGFIYVTRGILTLITSEAELAGVLGHEVAHVTARHSANQISQQQLAQLGFGLGAIFFPVVQDLSSFVGAGLELLFLKHSRDDEREADAIGFRYVREQGYAVSEFDDVFVALERIAPENAGSIPGWLTTHPAPADRVEVAREREAQVGPQPNARIGRDPYMRAIDGLVYGDNPRQGFFRDGVFYHPDLRFRVQFPGGWRTNNLPHAVVGAAPDGSAAIELTVAEAGNPEAALRAFAAHTGVQVGDPVRRSLPAGPTLVAEFIATTGNAQVRGLIALPQLGGRTYQLVGYATPAAWSSAAPLVTRVLDSFGSVTDPDIIGITPKRIDIVTTERTQTLAAFARRYPSAIPIDELAIINGVASAESGLSAGTLVKRVVQ